MIDFLKRWPHHRRRPYANGFSTKSRVSSRNQSSEATLVRKSNRTAGYPFAAGGCGFWLLDFSLSIPYLNAAWTTECPTPASKLVLVALADHANQTGYCFPSVARIAKRCGMSIRSVQVQIRKLEESKILKTRFKTGSVSTYHLLLTPAPHSPHPRTPCTPPPQTVHPTPAPYAPKPSVTVNESKGSVSPYLRISLESEKKELIAERKSITDQTSHDAWGPRYEPSDKERLKAISSRLTSISKALFIPLPT